MIHYYYTVLRVVTNQNHIHKVHVQHDCTKSTFSAKQTGILIIQSETVQREWLNCLYDAAILLGWPGGAILSIADVTVYCC